MIIWQLSVLVFKNTFFGSQKLIKREHFPETTKRPRD